jgi:hypothetical protein
VIAAESAIRAWVNADRSMVPPPGAENPDAWPVSRGAYLRTQRSPADGAYVVISRALPGGSEAAVAEPAEELGTARIITQAYAGTEEAAEIAATAYANAVTRLTGVPAPCGDTGIRILSHAQLAGPAFIPAAPTTGEQFCFQVTAEFLLADYGTP